MAHLMAQVSKSGPGKPPDLDNLRISQDHFWEPASFFFFGAMMTRDSTGGFLKKCDN